MRLWPLMVLGWKQVFSSISNNMAEFLIRLSCCVEFGNALQVSTGAAERQVGACAVLQAGARVGADCAMADFAAHRPDECLAQGQESVGKTDIASDVVVCVDVIPDAQAESVDILVGLEADGWLFEHIVERTDDGPFEHLLHGDGIEGDLHVDFDAIEIVIVGVRGCLVFKDPELAFALDDAVHFSGEFPCLGRGTGFGVDEGRGEFLFDGNDGEIFTRVLFPVTSDEFGGFDLVCIGEIDAVCSFDGLVDVVRFEPGFEAAVDGGAE